MEFFWTLNFSNPNISTNLFICSGDVPEKDLKAGLRTVLNQRTRIWNNLPTNLPENFISQALLPGEYYFKTLVPGEYLLWNLGSWRIFTLKPWFLENIYSETLVPRQYSLWNLGSWRIFTLKPWFLENIYSGTLVLGEYLLRNLGSWRIYYLGSWRIFTLKPWWDNIFSANLVSSWT